MPRTHSGFTPRRTPDQTQADLERGLAIWNGDEDRELTLEIVSRRVGLPPASMSAFLKDAYAKGLTTRWPGRKRIATDRRFIQRKARESREAAVSNYLARKAAES